MLSNCLLIPQCKSTGMTLAMLYLCLACSSPIITNTMVHITVGHWNIRHCLLIPQCKAAVVTPAIQLCFTSVTVSSFKQSFYYKHYGIHHSWALKPLQQTDTHNELSVWQCALKQSFFLFQLNEILPSLLRKLLACHTALK